jgi:oligoribonuclease NrnB/cAMP/cGMP phosphodiesterase (DHH superfamily)
MSIFVLYHANCFDGFGAKYAAWRKFGDEAEYLAVNYGQPIPQKLLNAILSSKALDKKIELYILDFSYPRGSLELLRGMCDTLVVLDHHKTAKEDLEGLDYAIFDMDKSGAVLAWEYFHPDTEIPAIILDIQDGDLWKFERPFTEEIRAVLPTLQGQIDDLHAAVTDEEIYADMISEGGVLLAAENIEIKHRVPNHVHKTTLFGHSCGCINCTTLISKTGSSVCSDESLGCDIALMYQIVGAGNVMLSFRASKNTDVDVSAIAKRFGGGGHAKAAGGRCSLMALRNILDGEYGEAYTTFFP